MTVLEATVEIAKSVLITNGAGSSHYLITDEENKKKLLKGIEDIYKKLAELEKERKS